MYPIDFETASPLDIIRRSIVCHPSVFQDRMRDIAAIHGQYANVTSDQTARGVAMRLEAACKYVAGIMDEDETADEKAAKIVLLGMDYWITSLNVAAKLQVIPFATISDIVTRYEAQREKDA